MAIEQTLIPALQGALGQVPVRNLHAEQLDDLKPADVPLVVVSKTGASFADWDTFCPNIDIAHAYFEINVFALQLEQARRLQDVVRATMASVSHAGPEFEGDSWEPGMRVYRVVSSWDIIDDNPEIT